MSPAPEARDEAVTPGLSLSHVTVKVPLAERAPTALAAPRDLPDLARTLFHALVPRMDREAVVVSDVSLEVQRGTCTALVGETRCGKTTLARTCARLVKPTSGAVLVDGLEVHRARGAAAIQVRRSLQVLFDDVEAALDPLCTVEAALTLADEMFGGDVRTRVGRLAQMIERVGVGVHCAQIPTGALPLEVRKRVALARALLARPSVVVWDEPTGGLDPAARAGIVDVLEDTLQDDQAPAVLVLTRDLNAARRIATQAGVLERGALVEFGSARDVLERPAHPHAQAILDAWPRVPHVR